VLIDLVACAFLDVQVRELRYTRERRSGWMLIFTSKPANGR
jgi:hypothetical protein